MPPTLLPIVSHAVIFFNSVEGSKRTGIYAMMKICFGSDDDAIGQIMYRNTPGVSTPSWTLPTRQTDTGISFPIFTGHLGEEILAIVGRTADRLKSSTISGLKAGRAFRVSKTGVEEIAKETTATK